MRIVFVLVASFYTASALAQTNAPAPATVSVPTNAPPQTSAAAPSGPQLIDGYAAKVNDRVITIGEVHDALAPILPELQRAYQGADLDAALEKAFLKTREELIERALILEAFKAKGGQLPDQYVNDEIKRIINDRYKGDEALFEQVLAQQKQTRAEFMEKIREQIIVNMMVSQEIVQRARITPEQIRAEYDNHKDDYLIPEKVKYSVIVLNKGETPEDRQVKMDEAKKIMQKLLDGDDFAETAKAFSEGSRAADGGAFPWMQPKDVRPELQGVLETLPAGQISEIVETDKQLYIVKVEGRQQGGYTPFEEVRETIKSALTAREQKRLRDRWIERLKKENYVKIY